MSEERDRKRAQQLAAILRGTALAEVEEEVQTMSDFAQALPWPEAKPASSFVVNLRYKLSGQATRPAGAGREAAAFPLWGYAVTLAMIALVVVAALVLVGPRISAVFGSVYNSLDSPSQGYGQPRNYQPVYMTVVVPQGHAAAPTLQPGYQAAAVPGATVAPDPAGATFLAPAGHMIVKNAQISIQVEDTDAAIARLTGIAAQYGGYILNSQSWYDGGYKEATVVLSVPSAYFEQALNRVREIATRVETETASGQDVTDQYVDLESQLRNLEATEGRLRTFLEMATTITEALRVNDELSSIEGQIERITGQMNYLSEKAAYSTIAVDVRPPRPTPTPTSTPTVTPTPTATPTPTPIVWQPGRTAERATNVLGTVGRFTVEVLIWLGLFVLPVVGIPALLIVFINWVVRKVGKKDR